MGGLDFYTGRFSAGSDIPPHELSRLSREEVDTSLCDCVPRFSLLKMKSPVYKLVRVIVEPFAAIKY